MSADIPGVLMSVVYGVGAFAASWAVWRVANMRSVTKDPRRWGMELHDDIQHLMDAHLTVAMIRASIAEKIDKVPKDFEDPLMAASELGFVVQRSTQIRCQQLGIPFPPSWRRDGAEPFTVDGRGSAPPASVPGGFAGYGSPIPYDPFGNAGVHGGQLVPAPPRLPQHVAVPPIIEAVPVTPVPPGQASEPMRRTDGPAFVWTPDGRMVPRQVVRRAIR